MEVKKKRVYSGKSCKIWVAEFSERIKIKIKGGEFYTKE